MQKEAYLRLPAKIGSGKIVSCYGKVVHQVLESTLEIAGEGAGLVALDISVLDWSPSQVVVHLNYKDGCRPTFILGAVLPWDDNRAL